MSQLRRAVFVDRDGTLIHAFEGRTPNDASQVRLLNSVTRGLSLLHKSGFKLVMVSNQGGIELGHTTMAKMRGMNRTLNHRIVADGGPTLDALYWCGHSPSKNCPWRKPNAGMLLAAAVNGDLDLSESYIIGDQTSDVEAGRAAGLKGCVSVSTGNYKTAAVGADLHVPNFLRAAEMILELESQ